MNHQLSILLLTFGTSLAISGQYPEKAVTGLRTFAYHGISRGIVISDPREDHGRPFRSNVSLNQINIHAYRRFTKKYPSITNEYWNKTSSGYIVSFVQGDVRQEVYYSPHGTFQYSARYFSGNDLERDLKERIAHLFPGYALDVAINISDGTTSFYLVNIHNKEKVKTIQYCNEKIDVLSELLNGGG
jgi:hypothetical protein